MRPDFRLSRESVTALLNRLNQERRHGWGALIEALVFLFWLASGAAYRVVSRVFAIPRATVHCIVHRVTEEVVATRHQVIHLPRTPEDLDAMSNGFAQLAGHRAFVKAAGAIDCCHVRIKPPAALMVITACAVLHNICIGAGDIVAPDEEPEDDAQDEGETGVEAVSGAHWRDQLSAEVSALEEVPPDHDYCQQSSIP
ncbi:unnamed protein product [Oreochromis niloticus]|nr:unnamed protein product [Mustela putorius furo]